MEIGLYSVTYLGIWYDGSALTFPELVVRAKEIGYTGIELDGKRPHGNPMDLDQRARQEMRDLLEGEGMRIYGVAANNDFSSPVPEHREAQLLMVRETARLAADLGAKVVRLFAAWPGVVMQGGVATYDFTHSDHYTFERQYPYSTWLERWRFVRDCLVEAAAFGEEFGVVMALQNHSPLIRHWKDCYHLVKQVNSPWLKVCLDYPIMSNFESKWVREAATTVGDLQAFTHYGGEFYRDEEGIVKMVRSRYGRPREEYKYFLELMKKTGYDDVITYELCHPLVDDYARPYGIDYVHQQAAYAYEFMASIVEEVY
jgi:sugar phosphate isomerase/epimerase